MTIFPHMLFLKHSVKLWNAWRKSSDFRTPYLSKVDLRETELRGADFSYAKFNGADLSDSLLNRVCFNKTILNDVTLSGAYLWETSPARWSIKSILCESGYWDEAGAERTHYRLGEYVGIFAEKLK